MDRPAAMRARRRRATRGTTSAAISVLLGAAAHTLSGGAAPLWLMLAAFALAAPLATWLAGRSRSVLRTAAIVAVSQAVLHTLFATAGTADPTAYVVHTHLGPDAVAAAMAMPGPAAHLGHSLTPGMLAGHIVAAILTTLLLARGERMLAAVSAGVRTLFRRLVEAPHAAHPAVRLGFVLVTPSRATLLPSSLPVRGPPLAAA